jgi:lysine-ketoglutarate reductase/saccharopine dehydrogenase-like protein (TIGR00300 family)
MDINSYREGRPSLKAPGGPSTFQPRMSPTFYTLPDFTQPPFAGRPEARFEALPADGVLPEGFFSTSNLPTYVQLAGRWVAPTRPRMDCVIVKRGAALETTEPRRLKKGELVAMGEAEDGAEGIVVYAQGFLGGAHGANEFRFMSTEVSRERPVNYEELAARVGEEKRRGGYLVWVAGPALVHSRARADFEWFIRNGYVQAVLAGNAVAVHDIEAAIFGTTLGMSNTGQPTEGGHGLHMRAINQVRAVGSIERAVESGLIKSGIMHALVTSKVPYVLAGSIRDDGPLPGVYSDSLEAQDAMREHTVKATGAVFVATALHAIAVGNMLPAFYLCDGAPAPLMTICVDQTEFVVNKLKDRGTHQAYGVVTNAQDFMHVLRIYTERWEQIPK